MELSERWMQKFEQEDFANVYEWQDPAGTVYPEHTHTGKVSIFITDGSITFDFGGEKKEIQQNQRFDVPVDTLHSAVVGPQGCIMIVGEENEEDS
jgi:quercetin dioxygenase-like cupin family protein